MEQQALTVEIKPEDFRDAPHGYSLPRCPLQNALIRMYPDTYIYVGHDTAVIEDLPNQKRYKIDTEKWGSPSGEWPSHTVTEISIKAKESLEGIPTVSLTLEPF